MKKRFLLLGLVGAACGLMERRTAAQGRINLDTYNVAPYPVIVWGSPSFGLTGVPVSGFTVGFFWAAGDVRSSIPAYRPGDVWGPPPPVWMTQATGTGATTVLNPPGYFSSVQDYVFPGVSSGQVTMIIAVYNGFSYYTSTFRGLSAPFVMTPAQGLTVAPGVGSAMLSFDIVVPEPSTFALAGLGLAGLLIFRRRK